MSLLDRAKVLAEVVDLGTRAYGVLVDKSRRAREREQKIKDLERRVAELEKR